MQDSMQAADDLLPPLSPEEHEALKQDIEKRGIVVPIVIDAETSEIVDGHHRATIARELEIPDESIPRVSRSFGSEAERLECALMLNLARRQIRPIQWGMIFQQLIKIRGIKLGRGRKPKANSATIAELAHELGVSPRTATDRLTLARAYETLPEELRAEVDAGHVSVREAKKRNAAPENELMGYARKVKAVITGLMKNTRRLVDARPPDCVAPSEVEEVRQKLGAAIASLYKDLETVRKIAKEMEQVAASVRRQEGGPDLDSLPIPFTEENVRAKRGLCRKRAPALR